MTAVRIISTIALFCYLLLCLLVMRDVRRREIRSFSMFLVAMLIWQVGVTVGEFHLRPDRCALGLPRAVIGLGGSFGIFYAQFARDFLVVRSHRWFMRVGYVLCRNGRDLDAVGWTGRNYRYLSVTGIFPAVA